MVKGLEFIKCLQNGLDRQDITNYQGRIQATSTYTIAEVTSAVVKLLKNTGIPVFSYKLFYSFLLPIEKIETSSAKVCRGYSAKSLKCLCMSVMPQKLFFPEIFENSVTFMKIFKNSLIIPHVCFSNACRIQQNARAEQVTDYVVRQLF